MEELKKLQLDDLSQFAIKGSENEWDSVLSKNPKGIVSLKRYSVWFSTFCCILILICLKFVTAVRSVDCPTSMVRK